jgi:hypothetical protein
MQERFYQIQFTLEDGRKVIWHKGGKPHLLPEELVDTWIENFKPEIFQVTADGNLVGVGRENPQASFKIVKIEKLSV